MILLFDIGNTRVKWATADRTLRAPKAVEHHGRPETVLRSADLPEKPAGVYVAHVMGAEHEAAIAAAIGAACGVAPRFARTQAHCAGLSVAYAEPLRLGVDRWLSMLALWTQAPGAFCVVNAGTALTFDAVDAAGRHQGGLIAPGLVTAQNAVRSTTRFEVRSQQPRYTGELGTDTESCVREGALHACVGLVEHAGRAADGTRYLTGGDAEALLPHLADDWEWKPNLVLEGLLAWARS